MPNPNIADAGKDTQWKPGQSGNPAGPPKGFKHINTWVQELLHDETFEAMIQEGYSVTEYKGAPLPAIIRAQIKKAVAGDTKAYDSLIKSGWAAKSETDITSGGEKLETGLDAARIDQLIHARGSRADIPGSSA
jgi:hypothetical protein